MKRLLLGAILALGVGVSGQAHAGPTLTFTLTQDGCTGGCGTAPWGTIVVSSTNTAGQVLVTETLSPNAQFVSTGAGQALEFSLLNMPNLGFYNLTSGFSVGPSPATASTFGQFDYSITCTSCGNGGSHPNPGPLSFVLSATTPTGGAYDLEPQSFISSVDNKGKPTVYFFASDIIDGNTGNVAALKGTLSNVPEPMSMALLGTGLVGLTLLRRKQAVY